MRKEGIGKETQDKGEKRKTSLTETEKCEEQEEKNEPGRWDIEKDEERKEKRKKNTS